MVRGLPLSGKARLPVRWPRMMTLAAGLAEFPLTEIILRLGLALAFGTAVGIDRQLRRRPAGMRTMMLVALGAATFVMLSVTYRVSPGEAMSGADMSRIIQGIVGGIGFLGAGVVLHSPTGIAGITTAAAVWVTAAVGVAFGMGEYRLGAVAGVATLVTLTLAASVEHAVFPSGDEPRGKTIAPEETDGKPRPS
jgi:putative Mg2+ transporter-C (MgtC) family protein